MAAAHHIFERAISRVLSAEEEEVNDTMTNDPTDEAAPKCSSWSGYHSSPQLSQTQAPSTQRHGPPHDKPEVFERLRTFPLGAVVEGGRGRCTLRA